MYKSIFLSLKKNSKNPKSKCDDHWNLLQMNPTKETEDGDKSDKWTRHGLVQNVVLLINGPLFLCLDYE